MHDNMERENEMKSKNNKQFMVFSALNMMLVVDAHAWTSLNIMTRYLTYNMFIMPAFTFVSGYFFRIDNKNYLRNKIKNLILPYYVWWVIYALLLILLNKIFSIKIALDVTLDTLILGPWKGGECWSFNNPSWFVCFLFLVQILYYGLHKLFYKCWNDWVVFIVWTLVAILTTHYVTTNLINLVYCNVYRVFILGWFYHFGVIYKKYVEKWFNKETGLITCVCCIIAMAFLNQIFGVQHFLFNSLSWKVEGMENFGILSGIYLLIVGVIGIIFWLKISQVLVPALGRSRFFNFVSNHTFEIMMNHIFFMWLFNLILVKVNNIWPLTNFDVNSAIIEPWYRWVDSKWSNLMYFICGLAGAMAVAWLTDKFKEYRNVLWQKIVKKVWLKSI